MPEKQIIKENTPELGSITVSKEVVTIIAALETINRGSVLDGNAKTAQEVPMTEEQIVDAVNSGKMTVQDAKKLIRQGRGE